jgi:hypothetical protein
VSVGTKGHIAAPLKIGIPDASVKVPAHVGKTPLLDGFEALDDDVEDSPTTRPCARSPTR